LAWVRQRLKRCAVMDNAVNTRCHYRSGDVFDWRSKLLIMSADGSDVRELTDSGALGHLPYWTRDGRVRRPGPMRLMPKVPLATIAC
jgi:hypothetical protein